MSRQQPIRPSDDFSIEETHIHKLRCGEFIANIVSGSTTAELHRGHSHETIDAKTAAKLGLFFTRIATLLGHCPTRDGACAGFTSEGV
jgi:hypothetical protein